MFQSSFFAAVLFGIILSLDRDSSAARPPPPLLHKRSVFELSICLKLDKLEGCRGGNHACCKAFCDR
ncbi:hypothetical protein VP01_81g12 [Puccinia sorghi]|uniref:Uncharacterized protein n=1 Tax=Puccinia sorghi TaxID=27349 RepID=A0A0L6UA05_9BASI|nr:hypothetical protein VP01_81g12 [Puccinia sorghi]